MATALLSMGAGRGESQAQQDIDPWVSATENARQKKALPLDELHTQCLVSRLAEGTINEK